MFHGPAGPVFFPRGGVHAVPVALAGAAEKHGVQVRYGTTATRVDIRGGRAQAVHTTDGDRITGIRGRTSSAHAPVTESATIVVGADGRRSRLARFVGADEYNLVSTLTCWYFSYWSGVRDPGVEIYFRPDTAVFAFPTNDALTGIFVGWPASHLAAVRADTEKTERTDHAA